MKRPIKFRAWIKDDDKWFMTYDLAFEDYEPVNDLLNGVEHLMQYIGLNDKYEVDIYEGDIVATPSFTSVVVFEDGCFYLKNKGGRYRVAGFIGLSDDLPMKKEANPLSVIGNIHENPFKGLL